MTVIYSLSTLPFYAKNPHGRFALERFELYTAALSALSLKSKGCEVVMHCDSRGAEYLNNIGIAGLWDGVRVTVPDDFEGIEPLMFWAAGKLFALRETPAPLLMLDTDFIPWNLPALSYKIVAAHRESLNPDIYPSVEYFKMRGGYTFNPGYNYSALPLNTAFLYLPDEGFKRYYVECAMEFMRSAEPCGDYLCYMVYAEQRLLAMSAEFKGQGCDVALDWDRLHLPQRDYTHLWGAKRVMRENPAECERFCGKCRDRIRRDFSEWEGVVGAIEGIAT